MYTYLYNIYMYMHKIHNIINILIVVVVVFRHFGLHSEDMYLNYLKVIITSWKSDYQDRLTQVIKMVDSEEKVTACLSQLIVNKVHELAMCKVTYSWGFSKDKCSGCDFD